MEMEHETQRRWFTDHLHTIQAMFDTPAIKDNYHEWDAHFLREGVMLSVRLYTNGPRRRVELATYQLTGVMDGLEMLASDVAAWLGLDRVDPAEITWRHKRQTVSDIAIAKTMPPMPGGALN